MHSIQEKAERLLHDRRYTFGERLVFLVIARGHRDATQTEAKQILSGVDSYEDIPETHEAGA